MKTTYYIYNGEELRKKDNTLQLIKHSGEKRDIPIERISDIYIMCEMTVNTALLSFLSKYGITVHFFNYYGFYTGSYYPKEQLLAGNLLVNQVEHYVDDKKRLLIAQKIIYSASFNIFRNLRYYNSRGKDLEGFMEEIESLRKTIPYTESIEQLMGVEGNIRKIYYSSWNIIIDQNINFVKRVKNPPDNMITH